jgi:hypothetical protein
MSFGYLQSVLIEAYLQATLSGWTDSTPASYSSGGYTIAWSHNGNTWTWTITYTAGTVHTIVVTVTSTSSGWGITITDDGAQWLTGTINSNGTTGTSTISDPTGVDTGTVRTAWTPASSPYSYKYTITATGTFAAAAGNSATTATVVLQTDSAGTAWTWTYTDDMGGSATQTH